MARARVRHAGGEIGDDILLEVFARLPGYQDILRCAATCKRWFGLITDPAFLRQVGLWPETARRPSVLVGIFSQRSQPRTSMKPLKRKPCTPPEFLSLGAGGAHLTFNSFVHNDDGLFNLARPLASRRGFLVVRALLPGHKKLRLAVCRPLIERRDTHLLPEPPLDPSPTSLDRDTVGWALLTSADNGDDGYANSDDRRHSTFQVLLIYVDEDGLVYTCMYSSDRGVWSAPTMCGRLPSGLTRRGPRAGVVTRGGTAHWLHGDKTSFHIFSLADLGNKKINLVFFAEKRDALLVEQAGDFFTIDLTSKEKNVD
ncbi:uncharacterized protein LOC119358099 [Triticum dicoccoides]|uniref:uncharacterized protein LOC119358099 n=1 Tax=Triticum dicoccoides TaxID=85692 RepID=UPI00189038A8|nr:uncharacterized protein LOC119358099 [Triticum dicoccoides]